MVEDNFKKGKLAEKIVAQMFKEAGFKVIPAGYEKTFSQLADKYNLIQGEAAQYIRHHPDFIVVNSNNEAFLIEVKYRKFGIIDQQAMFNYPATQVILLTKDSMHCQSLKEIHKNGKKFLPLDCLKPFSDIPLKIRNKYIKRTKRILGDENLIGQLIETISEKIVGKRFYQPYTSGEIKFTYIEDFNPQGDSYEKIGNKEIIKDKSGAVGYSNHGKQWDNESIRHLISYFRSGTSINDIAANLGRKREAVIFRLVREKLLNMRQAIRLVHGDNKLKSIIKRKRNRSNRRRIVHHGKRRRR